MYVFIATYFCFMISFTPGHQTTETQRKIIYPILKPILSKAWFTYISQTKSCDFVVPARSCDPRCAARRRLATLFIYFF